MKNTFKFLLKDVTIDTPEFKGFKVAELNIEANCDMEPKEYGDMIALVGKVIDKVIAAK